MSWPTRSVMVMPLLDLFGVSFRLALSKFFPHFVRSGVLLAVAVRGRLVGGACKMQAGFAVSGVLPHPMEPTLKRLSNQDLIGLATVASP